MTREKRPAFSLSVTPAGIAEVVLKRPGRSPLRRAENRGAMPRRWERIAAREIGAYFAGTLRSFSVPCDLGRLPPFTRAVLRVTASIPYGEVRSYRWVAQRLGKPNAVRAVGNALAQNPIPVIIPCHRVVRSDGSLGGYSLGLDWKKRLLRLERENLSSPGQHERRPSGLDMRGAR